MGHRSAEEAQSCLDDESHSNESASDDEGALLTLAEAKGMLRDVLTLCERQPNKKKIAAARGKAQGDPRAAMLSVVPLVLEVAESALQNRQNRLNPADKPPHVGGGRHGDDAPPDQRRDEAKEGSARRQREPLLLYLLRESQFLVGSDSSGCMKKDMASLRLLLSPP